MKRKIVVLFVALALCVGGFFFLDYDVCAEEGTLAIDASFLTTEGFLIGREQVQPMGVYLLEGTSSITKNSSLTIGVGGTTAAARRCDVSILVIVERYIDGGWGFWHSWTVAEENSFTAAASKTLAVARGYSYRVRCTHKADTDTSSSWTGALQM